MLGIIVQLAISWLIIWLFEKGDLRVLGFYPTKKRLLGFLIFFLITALCSSSGFFMRMFWGHQRWFLNPNLSAKLVFDGTWWNIKSVLFEELIFRGALFYILIKKLGPTKAILISAVAFGIYHWFSFNVIGDPVQMIIIFLITGTMGLVYAYAYAKTFSLYFPIAIHMGWNLVQSVVFSETTIGNQLLILQKPIPNVEVSYFIYFCVTFLPMISAMLINYLLLKKTKQVVFKN